MSQHDAVVHLDEAIRMLTLEAWVGPSSDRMRQCNDLCNIAVELGRVDCAIGPKGASLFGKLAQLALDAFVEIKAARAALEQ